jgi:genome maintenance exonuclease 1
MKLFDRYHYRTLERITQPNGIRHYICPDSGRHLPSVTTVLGSTGEKQALIEWRQRVGDKKADQIKQEATGLGSLMHKHLENYIADKPRPGGNNYIRVLAERMADQIIQRGLVHVDEVWGSEVGLYYPGLFAGTADGLGTYKRSSDKEETRSIEIVFDFKTTRKMKKKEHIEDYFLQLAAYSLAANAVYGHNIRAGAVFMVDRDLLFQEFLVESEEFGLYQEKWLDRLDQYYKALSLKSTK